MTSHPENGNPAHERVLWGLQTESSSSESRVAVKRRSRKEAGETGPSFPGRTRSQTPKGRFCRSPWQHISSHPPPVDERRDKCMRGDNHKTSARWQKPVESESETQVGGLWESMEGLRYKDKRKNVRKESNISSQPTVSRYKNLLW